MRKSRLLACAAAAMAGVAFPAAASAQACWFVGSAQPTPPCIVWDNSKVAQIAGEIREKAAELQSRKEELKQYTTIEGVMGAVGARGIPSMPSIPAIAPLAQKSFAQAGTEARGKVAKASLDTEGNNQHRKMLALDLRAAAGDGYSIAMATKTRFSEMEKDAASISQLASKCSVDARSDWSINTQARSLMLRALAARREIDSAQVQLVSAQVMASPRMAVDVSSPVVPQGPETVDTPVPIEPLWSDGLGKIANLTTYLSALITAKDMLADFKGSLKDHQETQQEYQTVLRAANQAQANLVAFANSEGARKRVSGASLLNAATQIMSSMDRTSWDDYDKSKVATAAAKYAKNRLDGMVSGDVSSSWVSNLANRAEAYKQEAFYREFNNEAKQLQAETLATIASYGKQLGVDLNNPSALDAAIAATQSNLGTIGKQLDAAPVEIQQKRDEIYKSTMETAGFPETHASS